MHLYSTDGSFTKVISGSTALSDKLAKHSEINDPLAGWKDRMFGPRKGFIASALNSMAIDRPFGDGECCIPWELSQREIDKGIKILIDN